MGIENAKSQENECQRTLVTQYSRAKSAWRDFSKPKRDCVLRSDVLHSVYHPSRSNSVHPLLHEGLGLRNHIVHSPFDVCVHLKDKLLLVLMALYLRHFTQRDTTLGELVLQISTTDRRLGQRWARMQGFASGHAFRPILVHSSCRIGICSPLSHPRVPFVPQSSTECCPGG